MTDSGDDTVPDSGNPPPLTCDYLRRKNIRPYGIKITPADGFALTPEQIPKTYTEIDPNDPKGKKKRKYLPPVPPQALVIPLHDPSGKLYMLQFILDRQVNKEWIAKHDGQDKIFWPPGGEKKGRFFFYGGIPQPGGVILVGEGYATMATAHEATGLPMVVAFDANNLEPVLKELLPYYPNSNFLILADDDDLAQCVVCQQPLQLSQIDAITCPHCQQAHKRSNAGVQAAMRACFDPRIKWITPIFKHNEARFAHFKSKKGKLTDFNDLFQTESLNTVRLQIEAAIAVLDWPSWGGKRDRLKGGAGEDGKLSIVNTTAECADRFSLIYGHNQTVFDHYRHRLVMLRDLRDACSHRDVYTRWMESTYRTMYDIENVGFDPSGKNDKIKCNIWGRWPTDPVEGDCQIALELLGYLCSKQSNADEIYNFTLKWIAYILQNPGAKMKSALIFHGPQGTGKNLFWESIVLPIFDKHGVLIGQDTLEDKHNDFASGKMFVVADEVVARQDLQHVKNKLKYYVTGPTIRINPKNVASYSEANLMNFVFNANGICPLILEGGDRRYGVVWTPEKLSKPFYDEVGQAVKNGLSAHFHYHLLHNIDLAGFGEYTEPPMTQAKQDVIELSQNSMEKFGNDWLDGLIENMPTDIPVPSLDLYETYKYWCRIMGFSPYNITAFSGTISHMRGTVKTQYQKVFMLRGVKKHSIFMIPPNAKPWDTGQYDQYHLGDCVENFRQWLNEYRGGAYE